MLQKDFKPFLQSETSHENSGTFLNLFHWILCVTESLVLTGAVKACAVLWGTFWSAPLKIHDSPSVCQSFSIFCYVVEWKLTSLSVSTSCKHLTKQNEKSSFDLRIQSKIFLAYYYFIPGSATKMCHHPSCSRTLLINGCNCPMVHARSLALFPLKSMGVLLLTTTKCLILGWT